MSAIFQGLRCKKCGCELSEAMERCPGCKTRNHRWSLSPDPSELSWFVAGIISGIFVTLAYLFLIFSIPALGYWAALTGYSNVTTLGMVALPMPFVLPIFFASIFTMIRYHSGVKGVVVFASGQVVALTILSIIAIGLVAFLVVWFSGFGVATEDMISHLSLL